jgi:hypothetical protein
MGLLDKKKKYSAVNLTSTESRLLFNKYLELGMSEAEANKTLQKRKKYLRTVVNALKQQNKTDKEINLAFTEEYEKMLMEAENGRFDST